MSIVRYKTRNSVYEHDVEGKRLRRVEGVNDPTPSTGTGGTWKGVKKVIRTWSGELLIHWEDGTATHTSTVITKESVA